MTLVLSGSKGRPEVKTYGADVVALGNEDISMKDFCTAVKYVMENTDLLGDSDPRMALLNYIKKLEILPGYNPGGKRLGTPESSSLGSLPARPN